MSTIRLVPIGDMHPSMLQELGAALETRLDRRCELVKGFIDPQFAFHPVRGQYHSSELIAHLQKTCGGEEGLLLGLTGVDLFIPILTFVFGEAQLGGRNALVSSHRLRQEFYGLPPDEGLLRQRVVKEAVHELGHTLGLLHCPDYNCVMAPSHGIEWVDLKTSAFCPACRCHFEERSDEKSRGFLKHGRDFSSLRSSE